MINIYLEVINHHTQSLSNYVEGEYASHKFGYVEFPVRNDSFHVSVIFMR